MNDRPVPPPPAPRGWHLDDALVSGYVQGSLGTPLAASVETHVLVCAMCRALLAPAVPTSRLDTVWHGVRERVEAPRLGPAERLLVRCGVPGTTARLLAATPSLRGGWVTGVLTVLALATVAAHSGDRGVGFFLALAPVLPVLGVAVAFGPRTDPLHEISLAAPYPALRLVVLRSVAVVGLTVVLAAVAAALLPVGHWMAAAWLLPSLALSALTLALAGEGDPVRPAAVLTAAWLVASLSALRPDADPLLVASTAVQAGSVAGLLVALLVVVLRRTVAPLHPGRLS